MPMPYKGLELTGLRMAMGQMFEIEIMTTIRK